MRAKKKRAGIKAQIRALKERERRIVTAVFLALTLILVIFSVYFTYTSLNKPKDQAIEPVSSQLKAAIIDQLSLTTPNQTFVETVTTILKQAGYAVDYYPGEKSTVDLYRTLPSKGHSIILLRVHAGNDQYDTMPTFLWTSEPYSTSKYVYEQLTNQLCQTGASFENWPTVFAIGPEFVRKSMHGQFQNSLIIAMGCETLKDKDLAKAFVEKGASAFVGWSEDVASSHTDQSTANLLQHLIPEKQTIKQAVDNTMKNVGPDPIYKSILTYYSP